MVSSPSNGEFPPSTRALHVSVDDELISRALLICKEAADCEMPLITKRTKRNHAEPLPRHRTKTRREIMKKIWNWKELPHSQLDPIQHSCERLIDISHTQNNAPSSACTIIYRPNIILISFSVAVRKLQVAILARVVVIGYI